jgi:uncharacterized cupin superfamily protein
MNTIHIPSLAWEEIRSPHGAFHSFARNISVALGGLRNGGLSFGGHPFELRIRRIPAGGAAGPFHSHLTQWELFVVQSGIGTVRAGGENYLVKAGDVFVHPPGETHQLINHGTSDLDVLVIADNPELDAIYYPEIKKWDVCPPGKCLRVAEAGHVDGEEEPLVDARSDRASNSARFLTLTPFPTRRLHPDDLPWDDWSSPKGKFHGACKELSIALGAKRNAPTGLGGHPFDLELNLLRPGCSGCPFHSHAGQWEMFLLIQGRGTVRAGAATRTLVAGDVVLHPPDEPHQITNASDQEDLLFYLITDNPPVDYWHYPDTGKWGVRSPRKIFRMQETDHWNAEE